MSQKSTETEPYVPDMGITYPSDPDAHMYEVKKIHELVLDENYPFLDKSFKSRFMSGLIYLGIIVIVFPLLIFKFGLKIEGRKHLRKNKKLLKSGAITVSNHVLRWDFLCILKAVRYRRLYFPAWKENLYGKDSYLIRHTGGIPVPSDIHVIKKFNEAFDELHAKRKWFHVFPESSNWGYYQPIRPFKKGTFTMAYRYNMPMIPLAFSYRKRTGLFKLFGKNAPLINLRIGEPIFPDMNLGRKEAVIKLRAECHKAIVSLAGIKNNPYPPEGD